MPQIRDDIKRRVKATGHTLADLSRETNVLYARLSGAVNGYFFLKSVEEIRIEKLLSRWEQAEQRQKAGAMA